MVCWYHFICLHRGKKDRMFFIQLVIVQVIVIGGIVFAMRYFLTRNITRATAHLERLSQDYSRKEKEAGKHLNEAKEQSSGILNKAQEEAQEIKAKFSREAQEEKARILKETHLQSEQIIQQANKTREFLVQEINQRIEKEAVQKACELIQEVMPDQLRGEAHSHQFRELVKGGLEELDRLHLPDEIQEVHITSAYQLTPDERSILEKKLKREMGDDIEIKEETDPDLIAGLIITVGSLVIDGSLRYTIQEAAKNVQHSTDE